MITITAKQARELTRKAHVEYISVVEKIEEAAKNGHSSVIVPEVSFWTRQKLEKDGFELTLVDKGQNIFWGM